MTQENVKYVICWKGPFTDHESYYDMLFATREEAERVMKHLDHGCGLVERWIECVEIGDHEIALSHREKSLG